MDYTNMLGLIAASLTTSCLIPQIIQIFKTRTTRDISLGMFSMVSAGVFCWLIYGILIHSFPVIIANSIGLVLNLTIVGFKLKYK